MSTVTTITYTCDNCGDEIPVGENETLVLQIKGVQRESDWCSTCHEILLYNLGAGDAPADVLACLYCDYVALSARGKSIHTTRMHR